VGFALGGKLRAELYIDYVDPDAVAVLFDFLLNRKDKIEEGYGGSLMWEALPGRRASMRFPRISGHLTG